MVPRVNLLPPEITDARRFRRLRHVLVGVGVLVVVLCGLLTVWEQSKVSQARADLEVTQAEGLDLQRQQARFAEVPKRQAELDTARAAREKALGADVVWYRFLTDLAVNTPSGAVLTTVTIAMDGTTTPGAASSPVIPGGLGTVKVGGDAGRYTDVASWLIGVASVNGLVGTELQSAAKGTAESGNGGTERVNYSGSAVISPDALSHRFDRKAS